MEMQFTVQLFLMLVPAVAQEAPGAEAEKHFRTMEQKMLAAKTLQSSLEIVIEEGSRKSKITGSVVLARGNKARVQLEGELGGKPVSLKLTSDGDRMRGEVFGQSFRSETPKHLNEILGRALSRYFIIAGVVDIGKGTLKNVKEDSVEELFSVSKFKFGLREKVGTRDAQSLQYHSFFRKVDEGAFTVWLDAQTSLPLKRIMNEVKGTTRIIETFSALRLDEAVDAKVFELPKENGR